MDPDDQQERQLNIHLDPDQVAGVYANAAHVSASQYEFTIDFLRIEHEHEGPEIPGVVVTRINAAPKFFRELIDALEDTWSKWQTREGIRNLPETSGD